MLKRVMVLSFLAIAAAGCSDDRTRGNSCQNATEYFKDHRTGICFAEHNGGIATVDCEKVEKFLLNP